MSDYNHLFSSIFQLQSSISRIEYEYLTEDEKSLEDIAGRALFNYQTNSCSNESLQWLSTENWYKQPIWRAKVVELITKGLIAPFIEEEDDTDYNGEEYCVMCGVCPKDKRIGWNWIKCSTTKGSHLICSLCLVNGFFVSNNFEQLCGLKYNCKACNKISNIIFVPPHRNAFSDQFKNVQKKRVTGRRGIQFLNGKPVENSNL
ncbi:hypothetical protein EIN_467910 [Entamoeba invadens IP1]|uniref:Uncharacterized protein n=1 Tax=Entamoeba invadens IP1 TaxID=370355 RepID=A0A0A1TUF8_ENTIV|nr:hypothetical protein EIN_467910 [Entamoeba invadens IP1]ELP83677.1 hypothetical protein EIN_467910 [Entamoeba invadens IP1]|eukprot:XP_004183023.1 hypothetical protein EIN_467910 [Entamoeba invadens IP1]